MGVPTTFGSDCRSEQLEMAKIGQNTKAIALLFGENWPILATFHSTIKVSHIDFWSKLGKIPRL